MTTIATQQLPSGAKIPVVGLGVFQSEPGAETYNAVLAGLKLGYRHIDTAQFYRNEADVARAIADSGVPREEVFVTSKVFFPNGWSYEIVATAVEQSVERIGGYIDLYLLHAPASPVGRADAWRALEDAQAKGLLRDIGVSNYGEAHLKKLAETWRVKPAVNQIELHPWLARPDLVKYCQDEGILLQAYSPLARATKIADPTLLAIAKEVKATPAQVLIAWSIAKGFITLPKSVKESRLQENLDAYKVTLSEAVLAKLDALDEYFVSAWDPIKEHAV
ncbi:hypothetical protein Poli38472_012603 [Pythium oligandrum]|uniref:NADP-dependent oxidoreductase domain-containing protein n=1 Tax=Pythium oligandrum TaxID=41045 RepID=A0A8K1FJ44_PYTOL|nr:hypothetical protein Poli38472_012603 [Pythium oligandrum]|eukprot:TMW61412.1 hypothetical protein Poli38472_012603 [Pythium oligandrum]